MYNFLVCFVLFFTDIGKTTKWWQKL